MGEGGRDSCAAASTPPRGLIQSMNPHWANLDELGIGFPGGVGVLPEIAGMPFGSYLEPSNGNTAD
jgi:hypothetical protein